MKVYTRVAGMLVGTAFRESGKHNDYSEIYYEGRWKRSCWTNEELKDKSFFKLVDNDFKLKEQV